MVADNPFTPQAGEVPCEPPTARVLPDNGPNTGARNSHLPPSQQNQDPHQNSGARASRKVQWTIEVLPAVQGADDDGDDRQSTQYGSHAPDLDHVNRALESYSGGRQRSSESEDYDTINNLLKLQGAEDVIGYVHLGETDGLPTKRQDAQSNTTPKVEKGRWSTLRDRVRRTWGSLIHPGSEDIESKDKECQKDSAHSNRHEDGLAAIAEDSEAESEPKVSANPPLKPPPRTPGMPQLPGGSSILASLLALYNSQYQGVESATPSAATTPQLSRAVSPEDDRGRSRFRRGSVPWKRHKDSPSLSSLVPTDPSELPRTYRTRPSSSPAHSASPGPRFFRHDRLQSSGSDTGVLDALVADEASRAGSPALVPSALTPVSPDSESHGRYLVAPRPTIISSTPVGSSVNFASSAGSSPTLNSQWDPSLSPGEPSLSHSRQSTSPIPPYLQRSQSSDNRYENAWGQSTDTLIELKSKWRHRSSLINLIHSKSTERLLSQSVDDDKRRYDGDHEKRRHRKAKESRKKQQVYIIQNVAAILSRQQFILKLARALMMFGSPTHRLETQIQATARVLDIKAQVVYLPNLMLISFGDDATHTSETKFLKQSARLDLGKLLVTHNLYWEVVHDRLNVEEAGLQLDSLMTMPPHYSDWRMVLIGGLCSSFTVIHCYYGSFLDALMVAPLGMLLQAVRIVAMKNDLFSDVFEIVIATLISFFAAALASSRYFCYTSLVSGGIVLILPGFFVLSGALELASRNMTAGAVRMGYAIVYSLFLGFGLSIGSDIYASMVKQELTYSTNHTCSNTHYHGAPWYLSQPSEYWFFLSVPMYAISLSLNHKQPLRSKELPIMVSFACAGWVTNFFAGRAFPGRADIVAALGSFCIGILGNLYGRVSNGASFPVMVTGILMQLPSGLKEGGLFNFANDTSGGAVNQYSTGFRVAAQLISVAVGLTVGLFVAAVVMHPLGGSRRRGAGIFSF